MDSHYEGALEPGFTLTQWTHCGSGIKDEHGRILGTEKKRKEPAGKGTLRAGAGSATDKQLVSRTNWLAQGQNFTKGAVLVEFGFSGEKDHPRGAVSLAAGSAAEPATVGGKRRFILGQRPTCFNECCVWHVNPF